MEFDLKPKISYSEKDFFLKLGENWVDIKNEIHERILEEESYTCKGCNYRAMNENLGKRILQLHLVEEDEEDPLKSLFVPLCKACHTTQHIDRAIELGQVNIVNSHYSQRSLIEMCRLSSTAQPLRDGDIRILKTTPEEYLYDLKNNTLLKNSRVKIIFTNKFDWGEL